MRKDLTKLELNKVATIESLNQDELRADFILELIDFGFLPGVEIVVKQNYPSQDKIVVQIGNVNLSLRLNEAQHIKVQSYGV